MKRFGRSIARIGLTLGLMLVMLFIGMAVIDVLWHVNRAPSGPILMGILSGCIGLGFGISLYIQRKLFKNNLVLSAQGLFTIFAILFATFVTVAVVFYEPVFLGIGDFLYTTENPTETADVIWILGSFDERYIHGVGLYEQGLGERMVMTLGRRYVPRLLRTELIETNVDVVRQYALSKGFVEGVDFSIYPAESTYDEAVQARDFLSRNQLDSAIIVSSPGHMKRVEMIFNHLISDDKKLTFVSVPLGESGFRRYWWKDQFSLGRVIYEYLSLAYYYIRYVIF